MAEVSHKIALGSLLLDFTDDKSALVKAMACCLMTPSHYLIQCWQSSMSPYGITSPQWVNIPNWHFRISWCVGCYFVMVIASWHHGWHHVLFQTKVSNFRLNSASTVASHDMEIVNTVSWVSNGPYYRLELPNHGINPHILMGSGLNTLRARKMAAIFQTTFSNVFSRIKIFKLQLEFHWSLFLRVQLTIFQHWFR